MNIKFALRQLSLVLLIASANGAAISSTNCKSFSSNSKIEVKECIENDNGEITSININAILTSDVMNNITSLESLEHLNIFHNSKSDIIDLSPLKTLRNLSTIDVECLENSKYSFESRIKENSFDGLKSLEKLTIKGCEISGKQDFIELTSLKELGITLNRYTTNLPDLTYLNKNKNLAVLSLVNNFPYIQQQFKTDLSGFNLKRFELNGFYIDQSKIDAISTMKGLKELEIVNTKFDDINFDLMKNLKHSLRTLVITGELFGEVPESFLSLTNLKKLKLQGFDLSNFSNNITRFKKIEYLSLSESLKSLPENIGMLKNLKYLNLFVNDISVIPESISKLKNLRYLNLGCNDIRKLPDISSLKNLEELDLSYTLINSIPESIKRLTNLKKFKISSRNNLTKESDSSNYINEIPYFMKNLKNLEELSITMENIKEIPSFIKIFNNLRVLDLSENFITKIPKSMKYLSKLEDLDLSYNDIKEIPEFLNNLNLKKVDFSYNKNLTGKTLINNNLTYCRYVDTKLCIADELMNCIKSSFNVILPC